MKYDADVDISLLADEYEDKIKQVFLGNPVTGVYVVHGLVKKNIIYV